MDNRIDAFYGRQSVDKKDSISIESQLESCKHELRGDHFKEYKDKGFSGKNTERPHFQQLIKDIENGLIKRVAVYKLDRISRSILDFANIMDLFTKYNVEFVSASEKFDTSTPAGRAMLSICIVFAQLERETIQERVTDTYYSRCKKGFSMGGNTPLGFTTEPFILDGTKTKRLVPKPVEQDIVRHVFEMYAKPEVSLGDISRFLYEQKGSTLEREISRSSLSCILKNPIYVQADLDVYNFFKANGAIIENDVSDFAGFNGCYLYQGRDAQKRKDADLKGQHLVIAPHEGLISSDTWLRCRRKMMSNVCLSSTSKKAKNTWLAGKAKCGKCGYALVISGSKEERFYLQCQHRRDNKGCEGCGTIRLKDLEDFVFEMMIKKMQEFRTLSSSGIKKSNPKLTALKMELAKVEADIVKLIDSLKGATPLLIEYAGKEIEKLDKEKQVLTKAIAIMSTNAVDHNRILYISDYLDNWGNVDFEDKRQVVDSLITVIRATNDNVKIEWKI